MLLRSTAINSKALVWLSLLISLATMSAVFWINAQIANRYESASGKTRALFSIIEVTYNYKYYWALGGLLALLFAVLAARRSALLWQVILAVLLALGSLAVVFLRILTFMVNHST